MVHVVDLVDAAIRQGMLIMDDLTEYQTIMQELQEFGDSLGEPFAPPMESDQWGLCPICKSSVMMSLLRDVGKLCSVSECPYRKLK